MLNHITIMGRLTDNPELRSVGSGVSVANFTLACNRDFKNKDSGDYEADFIDIQAWRHTAEFVSKYFTKGQLVAVEGRLQIESYNDREGVRRRAARVVASQCHFAEARRDGQGQSNGYAQNFQPPAQNQEPTPAPSVYTPPASTGSYSVPSYGGNGGQAPVGGSQFALPPEGQSNASNGSQFRDVVEGEEDLPF